MLCHVEQGAQDAGARDIEFAPKLGLRSPLRLIDRGQGEEECTLGQIRPANHVLDTVQQDRPCRLKQYLLVIRVELPHSEAAAACESTKRVRKPKREAGEIVEGQEVTIVR